MLTQWALMIHLVSADGQRQDSFRAEPTQVACRQALKQASQLYKSLGPDKQPRALKLRCVRLLHD